MSDSYAEALESHAARHRNGRVECSCGGWVSPVDTPAANFPRYVDHVSTMHDKARRSARRWWEVWK